MSYHNNSIMAGEHPSNQRQNMAPAYGPQGGHDVARGMHYQAQQDGLGGLVSSFSALGMANSNVPQGAAPVIMPANSYMAPSDIPVAYTGYGAHTQGPHNMVMTHEPYYNGLPTNAYMQQGGVPATYGHYMVPYTPGRATSYGGDRFERSQREVPGLDNRRASYSTTATESTPGTPFFGAMGDGHKAPRIMSTDRSSYTTPSPQQLAVSGIIGQVTPKGKRIAEAELRALTEEQPAIPSAVPAVFTTPEQRKSLEQCLENRIEGNKNVYIRGLHPTTDDELLLKYCSRFGEVEQSKAIIDTATSACKG